MIKYNVAKNFKEITGAWCLVYQQYLATSLILLNELSVFPFPEYMSNNTAVIIGQYQGQTISTVSTVLDS